MRSWPSLSSLPAGTTSTVATPHWAIAAPPKSNGAPHLVSSRPNEPLHQSGSSPEFILPYERARVAPNPDQLTLDFYRSTYVIGATLAGWDRAALQGSDVVAFGSA